MIKSDRGYVEIKGTEPSILADLTCLIKEVKRELTQSGGAKHAEYRMKQVWDAANKSVEELIEDIDQEIREMEKVAELRKKIDRMIAKLEAHEASNETSEH